jgi:hypothetical protein
LPSTVRSLLKAADLTLDGIAPWGRLLPSREPEVYVVALTPRVHQFQGCLAGCPISLPAIRELLNVRPELTLDGKRPTAERLADRIAAFWLPDEAVLYIGKTDDSLAVRLAQYYRTRPGEKGPHAGGWYLRLWRT